MVKSMIMVDPTQSYAKIQKPLPKIFIDIAIKKLLQMYLFEIISHSYLIFSHIIVWFYNIFII